MKIEELQEKLQELEDPQRTSKGNIRHKLEDIIIIGLCSMICNGNDFSDMEDFGGSAAGVAAAISGIAAWNSRQRYFSACV